MKYFYLIVFFLVSVTNSLSSEFIVKYTKGNYEYKCDSYWTLGTKESVLDEDCLIRLPQGGYLALESENGTLVELNKSGVYSVRKLLSKQKKIKTNVTKKFTKFIMDELGEADDLLASENLTENMRVLGAVERTTNMSNLDKIGMPRNTFVINESVTFDWESIEGVEYTFYIKDENEKLIFEKKVERNQTTVNLLELGLNPGVCYYWGVLYDDRNTNEFCIQIMDNQTIADMVTEQSILIEEIDTNTSLGQIALAYTYKKYHVTYKATECFEKAILLSPEMDSFKIMYSKYLYDIGMDKKAEMLIKEI